MDDFEEIMSAVSQEGVSAARPVIKILTKMWQSARDDLKEATARANRLRVVSILAAVLASICLAFCVYLGSVVHRQQGEINAIHRILEEGVVKDENHALADTYATMAAQELNHVDMLHVQVVKIIQAYRDEHGAPPEAMMAVWNWEHDGMVDKTAKIRALLDMYKR